MEAVKSSHLPQCQAVDGQIDSSSDPIQKADPTYTERRKVNRIPLWQRWVCPSEGCGREYKRTSTLSIGRHKRSCCNSLKTSGRSIFHHNSSDNSSRYSNITPIRATTPGQQIRNRINDSDILINHNTGGLSLSRAEVANNEDYLPLRRQQMTDYQGVQPHLALSNSIFSALQAPESPQFIDESNIVDSFRSSAAWSLDAQQRPDLTILQKQQVHIVDKSSIRSSLNTAGIDKLLFQIRHLESLSPLRKDPISRAPCVPHLVEPLSGSPVRQRLGISTARREMLPVQQVTPED